MKIKIFYMCNNHEKLEKTVNDWLAQNPNINVVMIRSTQSGRLDCHYTVLIQYT